MRRRSIKASIRAAALSSSESTNSRAGILPFGSSTYSIVKSRFTRLVLSHYCDIWSTKGCIWSFVQLDLRRSGRRAVSTPSAFSLGKSVRQDRERRPAPSPRRATYHPRPPSPIRWNSNDLLGATGSSPCAVRASLNFLGGWRRKNIPGSGTPKSKCLKYLQHQLLLRRCQVASKKSERTRVTGIAEIYARDPVARCFRAHYFCATPPDGLMNDNICCWTLLFFLEGLSIHQNQTSAPLRYPQTRRHKNQRPLTGETPTPMAPKSKTDQRQVCASRLVPQLGSRLAGRVDEEELRLPLKR